MKSIKRDFKGWKKSHKNLHQRTLSFLRQHREVNQAYAVAQQLITMMKEQSADTLEAWLLLCTQSGVIEVAKSFFVSTTIG